MNYSKIYNNIINIGKSRGINKPDGYYEYHHIVPKCLGGEDNEENLVWLTAKEHFICHVLLCKIYPNTRLVHAFIMMSRVGNSNKYHKLKERYSKIRSENMRINNPSFDPIVKEKLRLSSTGRLHSEETKRKMSENHVKHLSEEHKNKLSISGMRRLHSEESKELMSKKASEWLNNKEKNIVFLESMRNPDRRENISKKLTGKPKSEEHKEKIRLAHLRRRELKNAGL